MQIGIFYKYLYDIIIYPIFIHLSIYPYIIYLYPSFHPFIYWIIINTFLPTTSRCTATARKNLSIYPTIHLSFNLFKQIHFVYQSSIYFSKECFMRHPVLSFFSCKLFVRQSISLPLYLGDLANASEEIKPNSICLVN